MTGTRGFRWTILLLTQKDPVRKKEEKKKKKKKGFKKGPILPACLLHTYPSSLPLSNHHHHHHQIHQFPSRPLPIYYGGTLLLRSQTLTYNRFAAFAASHYLVLLVLLISADISLPRLHALCAPCIFFLSTTPAPCPYLGHLHFLFTHHIAHHVFSQKRERCSLRHPLSALLASRENGYRGLERYLRVCSMIPVPVRLLLFSFCPCSSRMPVSHPILLMHLELLLC